METHELNMEECMHLMAGKGDLEIVRSFIEWGGVSVDIRDHQGRTPLHWAAKEGRYEVAELLINSKCDLNVKDLEGRTPVSLAADMGKKDVLGLLIQRGADVNCPYKKWTILCLASDHGWTNVVRHIVEGGKADLNAAIIDGWTPLMLAAKKGHVDASEVLVRAGADVNRRNAWKSTALHCATFRGHTKVVQVLLEKKGLNIDPQDEEGETPLHMAYRWRRPEVLKQLLIAGANMTIKNNDCETALSIAIKRENVEDIKLFVQHGAFLDNRDYVQVYKNPLLKKCILKNVHICTQSTVNKFHCQSLRALYSLPYFAKNLPNIKFLKLNFRQIDDVENFVKRDMQAHKFCNVVKAQPIDLSILCVKSILKNVLPYVL